MFGKVLKMFGISIRVSVLDPRRKHAGMTMWGAFFFVILSEAKDPCRLIPHLLSMNSREHILFK